MNQAYTLIKNSAIYGLAPYIPTLASILILPLLTAHLTEQDYGIAGTISAYVMAIAALSNLGFNVILQTSFFHYSYHYKYLWRQIYGFLQFWMIIFALIQGVLLYFIIPDAALENRWAIIILSNFNTVFFGPSSFIGPKYYQLEQRPMPIAIRSMISGFLTLIVNYITIVIFEWGYMGWYLSSFLGGFFVNASYWYVLNYKISLSPIYKFHWNTIKKNLKISLPMLPHYYTLFLVSSSSRMVMDRARIPLSSIGEFNLGQQFSSYMESGVGAIERAISPMYMECIKNGKEEEGRSLIYIFVDIIFEVTFLFAIWSKEIFKLLVKNDVLAETYYIAAILVLALCYRPMYVAASNYYLYYSKTYHILLITLIAGIIAIVSNIIFIPQYGIIAACIITYMSFLYQGYSGFLFRPYKEYSKVTFPFKKILLVQILITALALFILYASITIKIASSIFSLFLFSYFFINYNNRIKNNKA